MSGSCFVSPRTEDTIATDMEQATGLERKELEALMQGKEVIPINAHLETVAIFFLLLQDPFNMSVQSGPRGTREKPTLVPSMYDERIVGCICEYRLLLCGTVYLPLPSLLVLPPPFKSYTAFVSLPVHPCP